LASSTEALAERIRAELAGRDDITEKRMFGGNAFLLAGNMCVAAQRNGNMLVRVDPDGALADEPHAEPMVMRGRAMAGWLTVDAAALDDHAALREWIQRGVAYASSLPPK
jgi:TfoX/Sxy family transcriptional regulator of competence genes